VLYCTYSLIMVVRFRKSLSPSVSLMLHWQQSLINDAVCSPVSADTYPVGDRFHDPLLCFDS